MATELVGRERELAEEAARDYEPTGRDIVAAISTLSRSMVVREEMRADIAEAIYPLKHKTASFENHLATVQQQTTNLNTRLVSIECERVNNLKRVEGIEAGIQNLTMSLDSIDTQKRKAPDASFTKLAVNKFPDTAKG